MEITPSACRAMALLEGEIVYCLIKTHSIVYLAELDALPYQRVVNYGDGYYYLGSAESASEAFFAGLAPSYERH